MYAGGISDVCFSIVMVVFPSIFLMISTFLPFEPVISIFVVTLLAAACLGYVWDSTTFGSTKFLEGWVIFSIFNLVPPVRTVSGVYNGGKFDIFPPVITGVLFTAGLKAVTSFFTIVDGTPAFTFEDFEPIEGVIFLSPDINLLLYLPDPEICPEGVFCIIAFPLLFSTNILFSLIKVLVSLFGAEFPVELGLLNIEL